MTDYKQDRERLESILDDRQPRKKNALDPRERWEPCYHEHGWKRNGGQKGTRLVCFLCGTFKDTITEKGGY